MGSFFVELFSGRRITIPSLKEHFHVNVGCPSVVPSDETGSDSTRRYRPLRLAFEGSKPTRSRVPTYVCTGLFHPHNPYRTYNSQYPSTGGQTYS